MKIALDYDETFTANTMLWQGFIGLCKEQGVSVTFVIYRDSRYDNSDIELYSESLGIPVVYTAGKQKKHCFNADIWIDDSTETIVSFKELGDYYDGCLVNNDCESLVRENNNEYNA